MGRCLLAVVIVGYFALVSPAKAVETRVALVIGNSGYTDAPLANPVNDARLMVQTLKDLGFDVIERIDGDRETMVRATFELQDRLIDAGTNAVGLFYYAGHGVQVGGLNYLIPLNSHIEKEREVSTSALSAGFVLKQMEFAGNRMNFVILDACRNNPLTRTFRAATRGLARMQAPTGSLIAYSTGPGEVAVDGDEQRALACVGQGVSSPRQRRDIDAGRLQMSRCADYELTAIDPSGHPKPWGGLETLGRPQGQAPPPRFGDDRFANRVLGALFDAGGRGQDLVLAISSDDLQGGERRPPQGKRPGLVKDHHLHVSQRLQRFPAPEEHAEFLEALGLEETGLARLVRAGYSLLHLITYFTAGPNEARAWTLAEGTKAAPAAGRIHTDFERGFIAAETITLEEYIAGGGEQAAKDAGKMRQEGRDYVVQDGDVILYRFNV